MHQIGTHLLCQVPEGARKLHINEGFVGDSYLAFESDEYMIDSISLPSGQWSLVAEPGKVGEELAKLIVEKDSHVSCLYKNYTYWLTAYNTALESFHSLCASLGMEVNQVVVLKNDMI